MLAFMLAGVMVTAPAPEKADEKTILAALQGEWTIESAKFEDEDTPSELKKMTIVIEKTVMKNRLDGKDIRSVTFTMDITKTPMAMDHFEGETLIGRAIFELDGDTLKMCGAGSKSTTTSAGGKTKTETIVEDRPSKFDSTKHPVMTLKRVKK
jgi:uncharacterized protein (TIGR03067 family)